MSNRLKFALAIVVVAGLLWGYQQFGTATIAVTSEPEGAVVRVDGRQRGITPLERLELDVGTHGLEVSHTHYEPHVEGLSLSRGDHLKRHVEFRVGEATFSFLSNPRGAWVEVDGQRIGRTPTEFKTTSGPHVIAMGQEERHIVEETHVLKAGETLEVNFNLNIDPHGSVTITTNPRGAKIEFLNEEIEYKPKVRVQIGEYAVRVSRPGYRSEEFRYTVRYGDNLHHVDLTREYGELRVRVEPSDAEVQIAYQDGNQKVRKAFRPGMKVPVGRLEVRARAQGRRTEVKTFHLAAQGATVSFDLEVMDVEPGRVFTDPLKSGGKGPELVIVPAGSFLMGDANGPPSEQPVRTVNLTQPFAVSRYEVTIGDYLKFANSAGKTLHERLSRDAVNEAMRYVSIDDAMAYAEWLSEQTGSEYRLISEAEWEYVARAGTTTDYFFGNDPEMLCDYANVADRTARRTFREWKTLICDDGQVRPGAVGSYKPNPFGVYDIYGNVAEWLLDCGMPVYESAPTDGSAASEWSGCTTHGIRGGSWDSMAVEAKSAYRNTAANPGDDRGIRLVRTL